MKKRFLMMIMAVLMIAPCALADRNDNDQRKGNPEKMAEFKSIALAEQFGLSDKQTEKFCGTYKDYCKDVAAVMEKYRPAKREKGHRVTDQEVEQAIKDGFAKERALLDLKDKYYKKFSEVLTPKQIKKIYEKSQLGKRGGNRKFGPRAGMHKNGGQTQGWGGGNHSKKLERK